MDLKTTIYSRLNVEGLHQWGNCPIDEVLYLKLLHRHNFEIIAYANTTHNDRDIEFIEFKHKIDKYLKDKYFDEIYKCLNFGNMSCEMIATELIEYFDLVKCEVNEDRENGAIVERK